MTTAEAVTITEGFTFAVASADGPTVGTHFHSSTGGDFGNPAGIAEVGDFFNERVRGLSEYDLTGLASGPAFVTFEVLDDQGLFPGENDFPFTGDIDIVAYNANNAEDVSDFEAAIIGSIGTFSTSSLVVGNTLSFDISAIYNDALTNGLTSLGIRLQVDDGTDPQGGAWQFNMFRLTTTDDTTGGGGGGAVPEPISMALGLMGLGSDRFGYSSPYRVNPVSSIFYESLLVNPWLIVRGFLCLCTRYETCNTDLPEFWDKACSKMPLAGSSGPVYLVQPVQIAEKQTFSVRSEYPNGR